MNYTSSHLANKRIRKQNDDMASAAGSMDESIKSLDNLIRLLDDRSYIGKKYSRRTFTHKRTGYTYELSHFSSFPVIRREIKEDVNKYIEYFVWMGVVSAFILFAIGFVIYMCL